jgi:hypothetical protein
LKLDDPFFFVRRIGCGAEVKDRGASVIANCVRENSGIHSESFEVTARTSLGYSTNGLGGSTIERL